MLNFFIQYKYLIIPFVLWFGIQMFKVLYEYFKEDSEYSKILEYKKDDSKLSKEIEEFLLNIPGVEKVKLFLIRYGKYYKLQMIVEMDSRLTLRQVTNLEEKMKRELVRHRNFHVKYPTIYITNDLEREWCYGKRSKCFNI